MKWRQALFLGRWYQRYKSAPPGGKCITLHQEANAVKALEYYEAQVKISGSCGHEAPTKGPAAPAARPARWASCKDLCTDRISFFLLTCNLRFPAALCASDKIAGNDGEGEGE